MRPSLLSFNVADLLLQALLARENRFVTLEFCSFEFFARCFLLPICQCAPF